MYIDRIDLTLPQADITSLLASFLSAEEKLQALPSVSKGDRKRYAKLGLKNEGLALQIIEVGRYNPDVIPRGINFEQIDRDLVARNQLRTLKLALERLLGMVEDSMLLTGVDIYAAALSIYHCLRRNAETTSLREVVAELKRGFARPSRKKKGEAEPAITPQKSAPLPPLAASAEPAPAKPTSTPAVPRFEIQQPLTFATPGATTAFLILPYPQTNAFSGWSTPPLEIKYHEVFRTSSNNDDSR